MDTEQLADPEDLLRGAAGLLSDLGDPATEPAASDQELLDRLRFAAEVERAAQRCAVTTMAALTRRTALGLLVESVGGNAEASRLAGIRSRRIKIVVYVLCALFAGIAGLMNSSNLSDADANNAGLWIELDAILAVVIGGTPLTGGRFSIGGTVLGALILQSLKTTIYTIGVPSQANMVFEAAVVIIVCLIQSPAFRARVTAPFRRKPAPPAPPAPAVRAEAAEAPLEVPS